MKGSTKAVAELSSSSLLTWKRWLLKLMRRAPRTQDAPANLLHMAASTKGLLPPSAVFPEASEKQRVDRLRQDLSTCMSERSLLVRSTVSASLGPEEAAPLPGGVETEAWTDDLSKRLTVSWRGDEAWHSWWKEKLGLDREQKVEALKRKRRREKEGRRAGGHRLQLSDSFSSSASCLSEWDDLSDTTSWFSTASQAAWSDTERRGSLRDPSSSCPLLGSRAPAQMSPGTKRRTRHGLDSYLSSQVR